MGPKVSLYHSKEPAIGLYREPAESNNHIYERVFEGLPPIYADVFCVEVTRLQFGTLSHSTCACYMYHSVHPP
jgi:hypothetical protein